MLTCQQLNQSRTCVWHMHIHRYTVITFCQIHKTHSVLLSRHILFPGDKPLLYLNSLRILCQWSQKSWLPQLLFVHWPYNLWEFLNSVPHKTLFVEKTKMQIISRWDPRDNIWCIFYGKKCLFVVGDNKIIKVLFSIGWLNFQVL